MHLILRYSGRASLDKKYTGRIRGMKLEDLCREKPLEPLEVLLSSEKLLERKF